MYILKEGQPIITLGIIENFENQFLNLFLAEVNKCERIIRSKESYLKKKINDATKKNIADIAASSTGKALPGVIKGVANMAAPGQVPAAVPNAIGALAGGAIKFGAYFAFYLQGKGREKKIASAERFLENIKALGGEKGEKDGETELDRNVKKLVRNVCDYLIKRFIYVLQDIEKTTSQLSNVEILTKCFVGSLIEILLPDYKPIGLSIIDKLRGKNQPNISLEYVLDQIVPKEGRVQFKLFLGKFNITLQADPFDETYTLEGLLHRSPVLTPSSDVWVKREDDQSGKYPFQCMSESDAKNLGYHLARPKLGISPPTIEIKAEETIQELANSIEQYFKTKNESYKFENNTIKVIQKMRHSRKELVHEIKIYKTNNKDPDILLLKKLSKYTKHLFTYYFYNLLNPKSEEKYFLDARENSFLRKEYDWIDSIYKACQMTYQTDEKKRKEFKQDKFVQKFEEIFTYLVKLKKFSSLKTERYFPSQDNNNILSSAIEITSKESKDQNKILQYKNEIMDLVNQCGVLHLVNENSQGIIENLKKKLDFLTEELEILNKKSPTEDNIEAKENYKDEIKNVKESLLFGSIAIGDKQFIETLLENNIIAWNDRNNLEYTALHQAAFYGNKAVFTLLLEKALKDNTQKDFLNTVKAKDGSTILHSAAFGSSVNLIPLIVASGININEKNSPVKNSNTALHVAAFSKHPNKLTFMQALVQHGAKVNEVDAYGNTVLHLLCEPSALATREMFEVLLKMGADLTVGNSKNQTPLQYAHSFKRIAQIRLEKAAAKQQSSDEINEGKKEESEVGNSNNQNLQKLQAAFKQAKNIVELLESLAPKKDEALAPKSEKQETKCLIM